MWTGFPGLDLIPFPSPTWDAYIREQIWGRKTNSFCSFLTTWKTVGGLGNQLGVLDRALVMELGGPGSNPLTSPAMSPNPLTLLKPSFPYVSVGMVITSTTEGFLSMARGHITL